MVIKLIIIHTKYIIGVINGIGRYDKGIKTNLKNIGTIQYSIISCADVSITYWEAFWSICLESKLVSLRVLIKASACITEALATLYASKAESYCFFPSAYNDLAAFKASWDAFILSSSSHYNVYVVLEINESDFANSFIYDSILSWNIVAPAI